MLKVIGRFVVAAAIVIGCSIQDADAQSRYYAHGNGYNAAAYGAAGFVGGLLLGTVLSQPRTVVVAPPQYVPACTLVQTGYDMYGRPTFQRYCQ